VRDARAGEPKSNPKAAPQQGEDEAFREHLADEAALPAPECGANGDLFLT